MERPFKDKRPIGPFAQSSLNMMLFQGSVEGKINFEEQEEIIQEINDNSPIVKVARQDTVVEYIEELDETVMIFPLSDELDGDRMVEFIEIAREVGLRDIFIAVGDPQDRINRMLSLF